MYNRIVGLRLFLCTEQYLSLDVSDRSPGYCHGNCDAAFMILQKFNLLGFVPVLKELFRFLDFRKN